MMTYDAFRAAVAGLRALCRDATGHLRPVVPGDDPQQIYVKRVDVEILWAQLDPPPVVELLTDLTTALAASPDVRISPYAMLGEVRRALERYAERCQAEGAA